MEQLNKIAEFDVYDTTIKDIAGLKDYSIIYKVIEEFFQNEEKLDELILDENIFDIRTEKGRKKVSWAIKRSIFKFFNQKHKDLICSIFKEGISFQDKKFVLLWHLSLNNRLIREVTSNIFIKIYYSGRVAITADDIMVYIKEIQKEEGKTTKANWSEETIYRIATKYLSLMTKLDFVTSGRIKSFTHIRPSSEAQVLFLYFAKLFSPNASNILTNELLPVSFISSEDIQDRLKKLSLKGFFNMNYNGIALNIELTKSFKGICDALYNR